MDQTTTPTTTTTKPTRIILNDVPNRFVWKLHAPGKVILFCGFGFCFCLLFQLPTSPSVVVVHDVAYAVLVSHCFVFSYFFFLRPLVHRSKQITTMTDGFHCHRLPPRLPVLNECQHNADAQTLTQPIRKGKTHR